MLNKVYKDKDKFSNINHILNFKVTIIIISIDKLDYYSILISMAPLSCYLVELKHTIMLIAVTFLPLTNFV